jgi:hypothetical protein
MSQFLETNGLFILGLLFSIWGIVMTTLERILIFAGESIVVDANGNVIVDECIKIYYFLISYRKFQKRKN